MKKFITLLLMLPALYCFAQDDEPEKKGYDPTNFFTGGSISFNLGGYYNTFLAGLHPHFGYTFAKWIDAAAVVNFQYYSTRNIYNNRYHSTTYGLGVFTRIYPVNFLYIQVQPEYNFIAQKFISPGVSSDKVKVSAPSVLIGAGYTSSRRDKNTFTYLSILVDILKDKNSPYVDGYNNLIPIIRAGVNVGLNRKRR